MIQRTYRTAIAPQELADFLVQAFDPQHNLQAQKIGQDTSSIVQIGLGDVPQDLRHAVTVAVTPAAQEEAGLRVTMGQQKWLTPQMTTFAATIGLIGILITPFALFALLWPLSDAIGSKQLPEDIWNAIDTYVLSKGGILEQAQDLSHPHAN